MRIGVLSDSHGHDDVVVRAVEMLVDHGVQAIVHCGDVGSPACLEPLVTSPVPAYAVAGNMDRHVPCLARAVTHGALAFHPRTVEVPLGDGQFLIATHGHDERLLAELVAGAHFPYVCHGHTHRVNDRRVAAVRVICPGALHCPRGRRSLTCALLDTDTDTVDLLVVA
ncbi:MAG: YfcE family phosphodiesterase [Phycisphaerae bacterium]|nr:YfcE family phosphodiesterase [Phycisphaerae bacterium]